MGYKRKVGLALTTLFMACGEAPLPVQLNSPPPPDPTLGQSACITDPAIALAALPDPQTVNKYPCTFPVHGEGTAQLAGLSYDSCSDNGTVRIQANSSLAQILTGGSFPGAIASFHVPSLALVLSQDLPGDSYDSYRYYLLDLRQEAPNHKAALHATLQGVSWFLTATQWLAGQNNHPLPPAFDASVAAVDCRLRETQGFPERAAHAGEIFTLVQ